MGPLRLGIIGLSEGNGHPYSWSAIFNGYDATKMRDCGFPVIPLYLARQSWPADQIASARVTHIWTQSREISTHVAEACRIGLVVDHPSEMLGQVDGLLLARDDSENHWRFANPFIRAGLPIYIDKPIATSRLRLSQLYDAEVFPGQIFTCSALRYAKEFEPTPDLVARVGKVERIVAVTPKSWEKYAVHVIEPALRWINPDDAIVTMHRSVSSVAPDGAILNVIFDSGVHAIFEARGGCGASPIEIQVQGDSEALKLRFVDPFSAFRRALADFAAGVVAKDVRSPRSFNEKVVSMIEAGMPE